MQGRCGNVRASARQQFISPGLLRQQHARRSNPNTDTDILINNKSSGAVPSRRSYPNSNVGIAANKSFAKKPAVKQHAKRTYANPNTEANDDSEEERLNLLCEKLAARFSGTRGETVANDDSEEEDFNPLLKKMAAKINGARGDLVYDSEHDSENNSDHEYNSEYESQYSVDASEDENTTGNMRFREKNVSTETDTLLNKERPSKKLKSMKNQVSEITRDEEEGREYCRETIQNKHMDAAKNADGTEGKRGRGKNKCKNLAKLKPGEKIKVMFYNNRALCTSFARHIGRIVRDPTITPVRVKKWTDIAETSLKHIFAAIKDKFENIDGNIEIDVYKDDIMEHARDLWNNWRGDLSRHYVKPAKTMQQAIKNCPADFPQADWEWLVKEHFYSKEFIARSKRNIRNRSNLTILHHSGSRPFRKVIYDNGGKDNNPPSLDALFFMTHTKAGCFMDTESSSKHAQLEEQMSADPSLSNAQLMDKCFPSKRQDHIIGYGGGVKARHLRSPAITKAELIEKLKQSEDEKRAMLEENRELREENRVTNSRVSRMEKEWEELKNKLGE